MTCKTCRDETRGDECGAKRAGDECPCCGMVVLAVVDEKNTNNEENEPISDNIE